MKTQTLTVANKQRDCLCGCPAIQHRCFGCASCTCLQYRPTGAPHEAWVLLGCELVHGEIGNPHTREPVISFETDGGELLLVPVGAVLRTPEQVRQRIALAVAQLGRIAQQFDREFSSMKGAR